MPFDSNNIPKIDTLSELLGDRYNDTFKQAFPDVPVPLYPMGMFVLLQLRTARRMTRGGLYVPDETRDAEKFRTQTALVRALGPVAYKRRDTLAEWPEGAWCKPGVFVRVPMYGGDRIAVNVDPEGREEAIFIILKDVDIIALVVGDPLDIKTLI